MRGKWWLALALCAMLLVGFGLGRFHTHAAPGARQPLYYVDPMHPAYRSDKPGIAPDCGMQLVPVYAEDLSGQSIARLSSGEQKIHIAPSVQQLYGIRLAKVERLAGTRTIRVLGRVAADETRIYRVNMGTDGYIKSTQDDAVGNQVGKDQRLATVYSPEFLTLMGAYLSANERTQPPSNNASNNKDPSPAQFAAGVQARADRLRNTGMSDVQIRELSNSRTVPEDVYVVSPVDGFVISRNISAGQRFERFTEFYRIADLSHVWILADVFGADAEGFRPGMMAKITVPATGRTLHARVSSVLPEVDPTTRTMRVRLEADNPGFHLRPDMFVNVDLPVSAASGLAVPVEAIVDSGLSKHVFVDIGDQGNFEAREVVTGWRADGRVQIISGLQPGDRVVSDGAFLIDSEARLQWSSHSTAPNDSRQLSSIARKND